MYLTGPLLGGSELTEVIDCGNPALNNRESPRHWILETVPGGRTGLRDGDWRDEETRLAKCMCCKDGPRQGSRGGGSSLGERQRAILALFLPLPVQRDGKTQINKIATTPSWLPILGVQSTLCSPSPSPERTTPPYLPACCSCCCYPSLLLHFRESPPSFALFPIASPRTSPLRQHHHHTRPRPRRRLASPSSPLLTRVSLLQTLLAFTRKRPSLPPSSPSSTASSPTGAHRIHHLSRKSCH